VQWRHLNEHKTTPPCWRHNTLLRTKWMEIWTFFADRVFRLMHNSTYNRVKAWRQATSTCYTSNMAAVTIIDRMTSMAHSMPYRPLLFTDVCAVCEYIWRRGTKTGLTGSPPQSWKARTLNETKAFPGTAECIVSQRPKRELFRLSKPVLVSIRKPVQVCLYKCHERFRFGVLLLHAPKAAV